MRDGAEARGADDECAGQNTMDKCVTELRAEARVADERAGPLPGRAAGAKNAVHVPNRAIKRITLRIWSVL